MATTTPKTIVTRSASINLADVTVDDIVKGATTVGAPTTARVSTSNTGYNPSVEGSENYPYTVTYSWTEELPATTS